MRHSRIKADGAGYYHCMSRIIEQRMILGDNSLSVPVPMSVPVPTYLRRGRNAAQSKTNTNGTPTKTARGIVMRGSPKPMAGVPSEGLESMYLITARSA